MRSSRSSPFATSSGAFPNLIDATATLAEFRWGSTHLAARRPRRG